MSVIENNKHSLNKIKNYNGFSFCIIFAILLISTFKIFKETYEHHLKVAESQNTFIDSLINLRSKPANSVYKLTVLNPGMKNPFVDCVAQPFVYPAVSEKPWINVINFSNDCLYEFYGFPQYGITMNNQTHLTTFPKLLSEMIVIDWPIKSEK